MVGLQKTRTLFACFGVLFCAIFLFAGCSSATQSSIFYADGSRRTEFQLKVDSAACQSLNINPNLVMQRIQAYAQEQEIFLRTHGQSMSGVTIQHGVSSSDIYTYNFALSFASFDDYCAFYGITQDDLASSTPEIEAGLFVSRQIVQRTSLIDSSGQLSTASLGIYIPYTTIFEDFRVNICSGDSEKCTALLDKIELNIIRCYPSSYGYRSNATETGNILITTGLNSSTPQVYTAHFWQGTCQNPPSELLVYRNYVSYENRVAWYMLAIILTLIFGIILTIILCVKNSKRSTLHHDETSGNDAIFDQYTRENSVDSPKIEVTPDTPSRGEQ